MQVDATEPGGSPVPPSSPLTGDDDVTTERPFLAMIWTSDSTPGKRVSVLARSVEEARANLEAEYGEGAVLDLHNEEDAGRPR